MEEFYFTIFVIYNIILLFIKPLVNLLYIYEIVITIHP